MESDADRNLATANFLKGLEGIGRIEGSLEVPFLSVIICMKI